MKTYTKKTTLKTALPRSKRLRQGGVSTSSGTASSDASLISRVSALEDLFEVVDDNVHVKNGRGLYSDTLIASGGVGSSATPSSSIEWEQLQNSGKQIANLTLPNGETVAVYAPALTDLMAVTNLSVGDVPYWDGTRWVNRQMSSGGGGSDSGTTTTDNPDYDSYIVATFSDGTSIRTALENGVVPAYWATNKLSSTQRTNLRKVEIGKNCVRIGNFAFNGISGLTEIYCYGSTAPRLQQESRTAFSGFNSYNGTLHYPANGVNYLSDDSSAYECMLDDDYFGAPLLGYYDWTGMADAVTPEYSSGGGSGGSSVDVIDSLTSYSTVAALSANQGRILNNAIATKSAVSWNQIQASGTKIATITIDGMTKNIYAPTTSGDQGGASSLSQLSDVALSSLGDTDVLHYDGQHWVNTPIASLVSIPTPVDHLTQLSDTLISDASEGDVLYYSGGKWVNVNFDSLLPDDSGSGQGGEGYVLPVATSVKRGGVKIGYVSSGNNVAVKLSDEKMYVTLPDYYIGTTAVQKASQVQNITGIGTLSASGQISAGSASLTGGLTADSATISGGTLKIGAATMSEASNVVSLNKPLTISGQLQADTAKLTTSLRIGDATLTYSNGMLTLTKADGTVCSFRATGAITAGATA